ncbi:MAG: hypothetical protein KKA19_03025 [Candidatus Margulisbacteria bacterium]|nr:hypothetical protein [Candidatus Margulisiibacteriota bacterium]
MTEYDVTEKQIRTEPVVKPQSPSVTVIGREENNIDQILQKIIPQLKAKGLAYVDNLVDAYKMGKLNKENIAEKIEEITRLTLSDEQKKKCLAEYEKIEPVLKKIATAKPGVKLPAGEMTVQDGNTASGIAKDEKLKPNQASGIEYDIYRQDSFIKQALVWLAIEDVKESDISDNVVKAVKQLIFNDAFTWENVQKLVKGEEVEISGSTKIGFAGKENKADRECFKKIFKLEGFSDGWTKVGWDTVFGDKDYGEKKEVKIGDKTEKVAYVNSFREFYMMAWATHGFNANDALRKFMGYEKKYQCYNEYFPTERATMAKYGKLYEKQHPDKVDGKVGDVNGDTQIDEADYALVYARELLQMEKKHRDVVFKGDKINYTYANRILEIKEAEDKAADKQAANGDYELDPELRLGIVIEKEEIDPYMQEDKSANHRKDVVVSLLQKKLLAKVAPGSTNLTENMLTEYFNKQEVTKNKKIDGVDAAKIYARYLILMLNNGDIDKKLRDTQTDIIAALKNEGNDGISWTGKEFTVNNNAAIIRNEDGSETKAIIPSGEKVRIEMEITDMAKGTGTFKKYSGASGGEYGKNMVRVKRKDGSMVYTWMGNFEIGKQI